MRKDAGVDGDAQRVSQLGWMLFLKVLDDRDAEKELLDDDYKSPFRSVCAGGPGRTTPKASPAMPCSTS